MFLTASNQGLGIVTETALLKVINNLLLTLDSGNSAILILLDLTAAFDTIHHRTLLDCLQLMALFCNGVLPICPIGWYQLRLFFFFVGSRKGPY